MAGTSTYLLFDRSTEDAFNFYKSVFGTEFTDPIMRHGDVPTEDGQPQLSDEDKNLVMNVALPLPGGHLLMGSDMPASIGFHLKPGNDVQLGIHTDTRAEADRIFSALSDGGTVQDNLQEMFWGDYYGALTDRFGVQWYVNTSSKA